MVGSVGPAELQSSSVMNCGRMRWLPRGRVQHLYHVTQGEDLRSGGRPSRHWTSLITGAPRRVPVPYVVVLVA